MSSYFGDLTPRMKHFREELLNAKPQVCVERANIMGDYVVSFVEAIPDYSDELLKKIGG